MQVSYSSWEEEIVKRTFLPKEDLTDAEKDIIRVSYDIFSSRLEDLTYFEDEVKRLGKELANSKFLNEELINELKIKTNERERD